MRRIDWSAILTLFVLGCIHNFVAAPLSYDALSTGSVWFVTGGITLWYASFINVLCLKAEPTIWVRIIALLTNSILVGFVIFFMAVTQRWTNPQSALLLAPSAWLLLRSAARFRRSSG